MSHNKITRIAAVLASCLALAVPAVAVIVGEPAPDFTAESTAGTIHLSDYRGKVNVLLAFYYKDFTSG